MSVIDDLNNHIPEELKKGKANSFFKYRNNWFVTGGYCR
jgi:hypothetical protein